MLAPPPCRVLTSLEVGADARREPEDKSAEHRHLNVLPATGPLSGVKSKEYSLHGNERRGVVGDGDADEHRAIVALAGHRHDAAHRLHDRVSARALLPRTLGAECICRAVDESRVPEAELVPAKPDVVGHTGAVVLHEYVGGVGQAPDHVDTSLAAQIDAEAALVAVPGQEHRALAGDEIRARTPARIAEGSGLDFQHISSEVTQDQ